MTQDMGLVPEGETAGMSYVVQYSENLWRQLSEERRAFCKSEWTRRAKVTPGCRIVALRLIPDPLFPLYGHETPYIEWQEQFEEVERDEPAFLYHRIAVRCNTDWTPRLQRQIMDNLRHLMPSGTEFEIQSKSGQVLSTGRV